MKITGFLYYNEAEQSFILILDDPIRHYNGNELTNLKIQKLEVTSDPEDVEKMKSLLNGDMIEHEEEISENIINTILATA